MSRLQPFETSGDAESIGLLASGGSRAEVLANAAAGLYSLLCDADQIMPERTFDLDRESSNPDDLLVDWLNDLLWAYENEGVLSSGFSFVELSTTSYSAVLHGELVDAHRHNPTGTALAATYPGTPWTQSEKGWEAQVILCPV